MKLPSKVTPYSESCLPGMVFVMKRLENVSIRPKELYGEWLSAGFPPEEFASALDALFAMGKVDFDEDRRVAAGA